MIKKFKAIVINNESENFTREVKEIDTNTLKDGNVLVKVDYSGLNYKDALILNNGGKLVKKFPHIPGIDFSGTVVESENNNFKSGDEIILEIDIPFTLNSNGCWYKGDTVKDIYEGKRLRSIP